MTHPNVVLTSFATLLQRLNSAVGPPVITCMEANQGQQIALLYLIGSSWGKKLRSHWHGKQRQNHPPLHQHWQWYLASADTLLHSCSDPDFQPGGETTKKFTTGYQNWDLAAAQRSCTADLLQLSVDLLQLGCWCNHQCRIHLGWARGGARAKLNHTFYNTDSIIYQILNLIHLYSYDILWSLLTSCICL